MSMQPKINLQLLLFSSLAGIGGFVVFDKLCKIFSPYFSWGSNMCKICSLYECESYNYFCDDCANDVHEEFRDKAEPNLTMYN